MAWVAISLCMAIASPLFDYEYRRLPVTGQKDGYDVQRETGNWLCHGVVLSRHTPKGVLANQLYLPSGPTWTVERYIGFPFRFLTYSYDVLSPASVRGSSTCAWIIRNHSSIPLQRTDAVDPFKQVFLIPYGIEVRSATCCFAMLAGIAAAIVAANRWRMSRRRRNSLCLRCRYPISQASACCPECGDPIAAAD